MNELTYTRIGDYWLPDIKLSDPPDAPPLGKYGMMHSTIISASNALDSIAAVCNALVYGEDSMISAFCSLMSFAIVLISSIPATDNGARFTPKP